MGFLKRLFERRSTTRNPADWLYSSLTGGSHTVSGVTVGPERALTLSSYFAAIRAISEDVAKLPLILYRNLKAGGKERMTGTPLYRLLHDDPNVEMSSMTFRETMMLHAIGWGGGFAEIVRGGSGKPVALWPLDPRKVKVKRNDQLQIQYHLSPTGGRPEVILEPRDVFHLHGLGFDGLTGYSVAHLARESIGAALAAEQSGAALFGNSSRPGGVLEHPSELSPEAKKELRRTWSEIYKGSEKGHQTAILEQGLTFKAIAVPHRDAQWIEARQFSVVELARWLRIPPHKIAHLINATFSNIEEQSREYVTDTLMPWMVRFEQEIARKLLPARSPLFAEHLVEGLLRGTTEARFKSYQLAISSGWMSRNEARALENLNPADGLDEFLMPLNSGEVGTDTSKD